MNRTCEVRIWRHGVSKKCEAANKVSCLRDECRIGCFRPARWKNPFFGGKIHATKWWRNPYNYAEHLCAECYDSAIAELKDYEEMYGEEANDDGS